MLDGGVSFTRVTTRSAIVVTAPERRRLTSRWVPVDTIVSAPECSVRLSTHVCPTCEGK